MNDDTNGRRATDGGVSESVVEADWTRYEQPLIAIVETIAAVSGKQPTEMPPLGNAIDVDALTALLDTQGADRDLSISFRYQGHTITVTDSGALIVEPELR